MRLFLHGRYDTQMLLERIKQAQKEDADSALTAAAPSSPSSSTAAATSSSSSRCYSTILLSNWDMGETDQIVVDALDTFLKASHPNEEGVLQQQHIHKEDEQRPCKEILAKSSFSSHVSVISESYSHEEPTREVILHNCEGKERLEDLVALLMESNTALTIRYDRQRNLPVHIARGLLRGAECKPDSLCRLRSLTLKGTTITPLTASYLQMALPLLPNLEDLTLRGNFTLIELDRQRASIVGNNRTNMIRVVEALHYTLGNLPQLRNLDLQQCHLPDEFLADLLEAVYPESIISLNLNGNLAHQETQHILYQLLNHQRCRLTHLDLSWQRLPKALRNYSILDIRILASALDEHNSSLEVLNLSENRLLDEDIAHLAHALCKHPSLGEVRLQCCRITDEGMLALAQALPKWPENLHHLHLDGQQTIRKSKLMQKRMFQSVLKNCFLKELALPYGLQSESIDWALELNKAGRRALLEPTQATWDCPDPAIECTLTSAPSFDSQTGTNQLCDALWPLVLERADRIARKESYREESSRMKAASAVFLLLREKGYHAVVQRQP